MIVLFLGLGVFLFTRLEGPGPAPTSYGSTIPPRSSGASPAPTSAAQSALLKARVVRVVDGDTVEVEPGGAVQILGYKTIAAKEEEQASAAIRTMVETYARGTVLLEGDTTDRTPQGELLRHVWLPEPDGRTPMVLLSTLLVGRGLAVPEQDLAFAKYKDKLMAALGEAQARCKGHWESGPARCASAGQPLPPMALAPPPTAPGAPVPAASSASALASPAPFQGAAGAPSLSPTSSPAASPVRSPSPHPAAPSPGLPAARAQPTATPIPRDPTSVATTYVVDNTAFNSRTDSGRMVVTGRLTGDGEPLWRSSVSAALTVSGEQIKQACGQTGNDGTWSCSFNLQGIAPGTQGTLDVTFTIRGQEYVGSASVLLRSS